MQAQFQGSVHTSALFLTAAAQNLLCLKLATEMGVVIASPWVTWLKGAFAPALVGLLVTPFIMYKVSLPKPCSPPLLNPFCNEHAIVHSYPRSGIVAVTVVLGVGESSKNSWACSCARIAAEYYCGSDCGAEATQSALFA